MIQQVRPQQVCGEEIVCGETSEARKFYRTIFQASKALMGRIAGDVVAGFGIFVNVAEEHGQLRH